MLSDKITTWLARHWYKVIIVFVVLLIVQKVFGILKPILQFFGVGSSVKKLDELSDNALDAVVKERQKVASSMRLSKPVAYWANLAEMLYSKMRYYGHLGTNSDIVEYMKHPQNDLDYLTLVEAFGKRKEIFGWVETGEAMTLPVFVKDEITRSEVSEINNDYASKGITYRI